MTVKIMDLATYIKLYYPWLEQSIKNQTANKDQGVKEFQNENE